jgi:hypothetical protein
MSRRSISGCDDDDDIEEELKEAEDIMRSKR